MRVRTVRYDEPDTLRLLPQVRSVHLELRPLQRPARTLYLVKNYDLLGAEPEGFRQVGYRELLAEVWRSRASRLEIWEPLWMRYLPWYVAVVAVWRLRHGLRAPVLVHAMENARPEVLLGAGRPLPRLVTVPATAALGALVRGSVSAVVFASDGSRSTYHALPGVRRVPWQLVPDLPLPAATRPADARGAVFVGRLVEHKGVLDLERAWELVEETRFDRLVLVGGGPLADQVRDWCARRPDSRVYLGELEHDEAMRAVERAAVLVLPSRPRRRWREQVGLPLREALARGLTVVTTSETGIADWVAEHGHHVVEVGDVSGLAAAVADALERPLRPEDVQASLPSRDARVEANEQLHAAATLRDRRAWAQA